MRYVTAKEMKEIDTKTINQHGIPASVLMENAGRAVTDAIREIVQGKKVMILAGYGNNGGDGLVTARHLINKGYEVDVFLVGDPRPFSPETNANYEALIKLGHRPRAISKTDEIGETVLKSFGKVELVIDAIFGIGIKGELKEFYIKLIKEVNSAELPTIAVDIPSGLDADTGKPKGAAIKATKTVTMGFPKVGFKNSKAKEYIGELIVADIGLR